jgi:hypothetical protein
MDERQVGLGILAPVLYRVQKLGIGPGQTGQLLGVELVGLTPFAVDQSCLSGVGYEDLVTALLEQPTHPRRVSADLDGYLERPLGAEAPLEGFGSGTQPALLDDLTAFVIQQTEIAVLVSQIQPDRHLGCSFATIVHGPISSFH